MNFLEKPEKLFLDFTLQPQARALLLLALYKSIEESNSSQTLKIQSILCM